jgi:hypothetical protein
MNIPRRIVLSRKGFDSKYGGCASPILSDGTLTSMPIRDDGMPIRYQDINTVAGGLNLGNVVCKLKGCNVRSDSGVHLDPDRRELHGSGNPSWRPMFGQSDAAERHLERQGVGSNDLFLFFGWFRQVDKKLQFERSAHDEHVVWGWLQVDHCFDPREKVPEWGKSHPHCVKKDRKYNRVYVGRESLSFAISKPGAGAFTIYHQDLRLTHPDETRRRSQWRIPSFFRDRLTYHKTAKWIEDGSLCTISSAKIGQEFVFDTAGRESEVQTWLRTLFSHVPNGKSF